MDITKVINERNIEAIDDSFEINLENAPDIDPKHLMMTPIYYSPEQKQRRFQVSPSRNDYKNLPNSKPSLRRNLFSLEDAYVSPSKPKDEKISEDEPSFTQLSPIKAKPPPKAKRSRNNAFRHEDGSYKIRKLAELLHVERDGIFEFVCIYLI